MNEMTRLSPEQVINTKDYQNPHTEESQMKDAIHAQTSDDTYYNELNQYFKSLAKELSCSESCAQDVWYLRQRSRWTQELENELISLDEKGIRPNINEFGHTDLR